MSNNRNILIFFGLFMLILNDKFKIIIAILCLFCFPFHTYLIPFLRRGRKRRKRVWRAIVADLPEGVVEKDNDQ